MGAYFQIHINEATDNFRPFPHFLHPHIFPLISIVLAFSRAGLPCQAITVFAKPLLLVLSHFLLRALLVKYYPVEVLVQPQLAILEWFEGRWWRRFISSRSRQNFSAARLRSLCPQPFVSSTPPVSRNRVVMGDGVCISLNHAHTGRTRTAPAPVRSPLWPRHAPRPGAACGRAGWAQAGRPW